MRSSDDFIPGIFLPGAKNTHMTHAWPAYGTLKQSADSFSRMLERRDYGVLVLLGPGG